MLTDFFSKILNSFDKPDIEEIAAYQHKLPFSVLVRHNYDAETKFYTAQVIKIDGKEVKDLIITESRTVESLIEMLNDAILTKLDIPERVKNSMPKLLPADIDFSDKLLDENGQLVFAK